MTEQRYLAPGRPTRALNTVVRWLTRRGVSVWGSRVLAVRGRTSGEWRSTPVNVLTYDGKRYLVSPRGHSQWVRNIRVAGTAQLQLGRRVEDITVTELDDVQKVPVIRAYLKRWKAEVGVFFDGLGAEATDAELLAAGPKHPVFRVHPA